MRSSRVKQIKDTFRNANAARRLGQLAAIVLSAFVSHFVVVTAMAQVSFSYDLPGNLLSESAESAGPPVVLRQPAMQVVSAGNNGSFSVLVADTAAATYQWWFSGTSITGATGDTLLLTNVSAASQGNYFVVVANPSGSVTSAPAMLWWDSVGDGLPDSWKTEYFGSITSVTAAGDAVGDGVSNLEKFYEGMNPTNGIGLNPRLFVNGLNGGISVSPDLDKYTLGQIVTLTPVPVAGFQFFGWAGDLSGANNPASLTMSTNKYITAVCGLPLTYALDTTNLVWRTGGDVPWFGQNYVTYDGIASAQSGPITTNQQTWMETTVVMDAPGTVSFWWKFVPSGVLTFSVNGVVPLGTVFGGSDWREAVCYLPAGTDVLRWSYAKGMFDYNQGFDAFWVDQVAVTVYTDPLLDTDGDGLPDLWEYRYFGNLAYSGTGDPDGDGVNNHDEYLDGTDPSDPTSVFPRLTLSASGGRVTASPSLAKYSYLQPVTLTAVPATGFTFIGWGGDLSGTANPMTVNMNLSMTATALFAMSAPNALGVALDATNLAWTTGGYAPWLGQPLVSYDGVAAAQRGAISDPNQVSWIQTTVTGPGPLRFWWNAQLNYCCADLIFSIDGIEQTNFSASDWEQQVFDIPNGTHVLQWALTNSPFGGDPGNVAWLDQVSFGDNVPLLTQFPISQTVFQGNDVTFTVSATSSLPLSYQWQENGVDLTDGGSISGAMTDALTLSSVQTNQTGTYSVVVTTDVDAASSAATLTVIGLLPLPQALNAPSLPWSTGGYAPWFGQTAVSHDGNSAGQSGTTSGGQQSWVQTTLSGPGKLSFWWKVSGFYYNSLVFQIGTETNASISGEVDWVPRSVLIPSGTQVVEWLALQSSDSGGAWLDQVSFTPGSPPSISSQPGSQSVAAGTNVSFSVSAMGSTPLTYQWLFGGTNIPGATQAALNLTNVQAANAGDYAVVVSNAVSSVISADAQLIVIGVVSTPMKLAIGVQPNGSISIQFSGTPGASYSVIGTSDISLPLASWTVLGQATEYSTGLYQFTDTRSANNSERFYRVRSP